MKLKKRIILLVMVIFSIEQIHLLYNTWTRQRMLFENSSAANNILQISKVNTRIELTHQATENSETKSNENRNIFGEAQLEFNDDNRSNIQKISISYDSFQLPEPNFISEEDRFLFYKNPVNIDMGKLQNETEKLRGEIYNIRSGTFELPYDCGFRSNYTFVTKQRRVSKSNWYFALAPMMVPEGHTFQHFIDGTLPKIIQALDYLQKPYMKVLIKRPRDKIVSEMIEKLNINKKNIVFHSNVAYGADNLLFSCNTPPLHPELWSRARKLIGAHVTLTTDRNNSKIVLMTRVGSFNRGRNILNMQETLDMLYSKYGKANIHVFKGPYTLQSSIELFGQAKTIIGVHGGGLYNILFCPKETNVVEIMPTKPDGKMMAASDRIFWAQAFLLGQKYWRLSLRPNDQKGNVFVDVKKLERILDKIDS